MRGQRYDDSDPEALRGAVRAIVDYRGDVTITRRSGESEIVGYVFDCRDVDDRAHTTLRLMTAADDAIHDIPLADVASIEVSGRDTAAGKSFDTWVKKYAREKLGITVNEDRNADRNAE